MGPSLASMKHPGRWEIVKDVQVTRENFLRAPNSNRPTVIRVLKVGEVVQVVEYCEDCGGTMRGKCKLENDLVVLAMQRQVQARKLRGEFKLETYGWIDLYAPYCAKDPPSRIVYAKQIYEVSSGSNEGCTQAVSIEEDTKPGADQNATELGPVPDEHASYSLHL